ncbi:hypothetical protein G6F57_006205 [Rhizopus arrhizus]|uniref:F-box domain-containing protein n=1 Tax=Rhizopus oryzae TaxID=64495 RepID=A0A9P7BTS9_RHIOR|nr:hypothetical protein G6F23_002360 [Rhizopus arrhizus]KAG1426552.1 hypothetical protein G6F58_001422 [Rhizopus delemar]KAG0767474.1 hypothetical protein G6F24_002752 [Rhizopus arrhizus]KAG0790881.1 hypothetical protein G6F22_006294 [Rhizopus arrhizus]KAG0796551.1 hypothetical protein G6F21_001215 [Rhizopus arrhizus]
MTILTSSLIPPSTAKLLSYFSNNKLHVHQYRNQKGEQVIVNTPTYVTIVMRKDGTPTIKSTSNYSSSSSGGSSSGKRYSPPKQRKLILSNLIPRLSSHHQQNNCKKINTAKKAESTSGDVRRFQELPHELIIHILFYLDYKSILTLSRASKQFYTLSHKNHNLLWQSIFQYDFNLHQQSITPYYQLYKNHFELHKRWRHGHVRTKYLTGHDDSIYCLVWLGKHHIISGSRDKSIKVWNLHNTTCPLQLTRIHHEGSVLCLRLSKDNLSLVSGSSDSTCFIWSLPTLLPEKRLVGHTGGVLDICLVKNYIISSSRDSTIRVWDKHTGHELRRLTGHAGPVNALGSQGTQVVSASGDTTIKLWDIETGQCLRTFNGHTRGLACIKLDGCFIYSGGQDNKLKIWDIQTGQCISSLSGHSDLIRTIDTFEVSYSDITANLNTYVSSAGQDKRIMVLDFGYDLTLI